jgi:hypothetical protein
MSLDIYFYINLLTVACASMQSINFSSVYRSIYLAVYSHSSLFFLCMKYVSREIIRILSFFLFFCICVLCRWNDNGAILVIQ